MMSMVMVTMMRRTMTFAVTVVVDVERRRVWGNKESVCGDGGVVGVGLAHGGHEWKKKCAERESDAARTVSETGEQL